MRKKVIAILLIAIMMTMCFSGNLLEGKEAQATDVDDTIVIAVDESFGDLDITSQIEHSNSADWIYRMIYDRLLEFNKDGELIYSLATSMTWVRGETPEDQFDLIGIGYSGNYVNNGLENSIPGWTSTPNDIDWELEAAEYLGDGDGIILNIKLREDVYFTNGENLTIETFEDMITGIKTYLPQNSLMRKQWSPLVEIEDYGYVKASDTYEGEIKLSFTDDIPF